MSLRQMSGISVLGGIFAYTRFNSVPSLLGSFGIGSALALSSMRIRDGLDYGIEGAAGKSGLKTLVAVPSPAFLYA